MEDKNGQKEKECQEEKNITLRKIIIDTLRQIKGAETKLKEMLDTIKK